MATIVTPPIINSPTGLSSLPINDFGRGVSTPPLVGPSDTGLSTLPTAVNAFNENILSDVGSGVTQLGAGPSFSEESSQTDATINYRDYNPTIDSSSVESQRDWRMRISLGPNANYLYTVATDKTHILHPLKDTNGVIFPYTPQVSVTYTAAYNSQDITHSNFKFHQYQGSEVGNISITADFTAQDTHEANYLLAVIHFFKSMTKMFYGSGPNIGLPPPLCYIEGFGSAQFDHHPMVITSFNYQMPHDVDYIRASIADTANTGYSLESFFGVGISATTAPGINRLAAAGLSHGGTKSEPKFKSIPAAKEATYVPTKVSLSIQCLPVVSRNDMSKNFSLEKYAAGRLRGSHGGIW